MENKDAIEELKGLQEFINGTRLKGEIRAEAFDLAIKALDNQPRWIPVTEKLPDKSYKTYLVSIDYGKHRKAVMSLFWHNEEFGWDNGFNDSVVAWMPLPEPYTKEETT